MRGSVRKRTNKTGVSWIVRVEYPANPTTGERVQKAETYRTRDEAHTRLTAWLTELRGGAAIVDRNLTVAAFFEQWLAAVKPNVRPTTYRFYEQQVRLYLKPRLGTVKLGKLQPFHLQTCYSALRTEGKQNGTGLSPRSVQHAHRVAHEALRHALDWGMIAKNPADIAKPGQVPKVPIAIWDTGQLRAFLVLPAVAAEPWGPVWLLAASTGMRRGELLALSWSAVDLPRSRVEVRRNLVEVGGELLYQPPKTASARRSIPIDAACVAALKQHKARQNARRLAMGDLWHDEDLVFSVGHGGPIRPSNLTDRFSRLVDRADLPDITFHGIRHSHATMLLREGVPVKVVSERLGHASISVTLDVYAHVLPDMQELAVAAVEKSLALMLP